VRRPLWSPKFQPGIVRESSFTTAVNDAANYLRDYFPEVFSELKTVIADLPPAGNSGSQKFSVHKPSSTVYLYRIPIQHIGRRRDPIDEMLRIEQIVIEAAASLIDRDPRDFLGED
jgi:hypothetical protein